ncbi:ABC transporter ATP-binding protein [Microbacterium sp. ET2]|uniref:ABC transporter ATP-binding protein n=1 Tax=Microbacterium albipurpureum TaxID=3050384 RepID=UPI00259CA011|nr:ABC transporter ATP-binding protein [Microbacterium sp. ET2 (Ac-2212)]WJL94124.1 ABC transporter ATP-binding protein [Microbacterium sp. ET2 (Ac-2212)]
MSTMAMLRPVLRLLTVLAPADRRLFIRSALSMTAYQLAAAAAAGLSAAIASVVTAGDDAIVAALLIGLAAAIVTCGAFTWIESWLSHVLAYRVIAALRLRVYDAIERIVPGRSARRRAGEVTGTAMGDVEAMEWFYAHTLGAALNALLTPVPFGIALVILVGPVGLVVPVGIALLLTVPWLLAPAQTRQGADIRERLGALRATTFEGMESRRDIAALDLAGQHRDTVLAHTRAVQSAKRRFSLRSALEAGLADLVVAATTFSFLLILVGAAAAGAIDPVLIPPATVLATASIVPAAGAFAMLQRIGEMSAAATRILSLLDEPDEVFPGDDTRPGLGAGAVQLRDVTFGYTAEHLVLDGLDLDIQPGEHLALVGASGAGKSTIARLLTRLWDPTSGSILLDGRPLRTLTPDTARREVALIPQHPFIFRGSLRDNLLLAHPDATDAQLEEAVQRAGLADTVATFARGFDEPVGERGTALSGGQRQRVAIAQAMLRDAAVLILDEASANLDTILERDLADTLARVRFGRTTIVIAHRVSTIRRMPRVVLIEDGRVIADGTHDTLTDDPRYRSLLALEDPDASTIRVGAREGRRG